MSEKTLSIDLIRLDGDTQSRVKINEEAVADYCDIITEADDWPFEPLDVFHDGTDYFLADGFHRTLAAHRAKRASIPCRIHTGGAFDAHVFGMTANDRHGLRMTRDDKRHCVEWLLDNGPKMTQKDIAEKAGVTSRTVKAIVADRNDASVAGKVKPPKRDGEGKVSPSTPISGGKEPEDHIEEPLEMADPGEPDPETDTVDYGQCPNCAGTKWNTDAEGVACAKCQHPHGEPAGDVDAERIKTQRQKTVKTAEALMRAIDDLHLLCPSKEHDGAIEVCKAILKLVKGWK